MSTDLNYIYQDTKNKASGCKLAYSPKHNTKITVKFVLPAKTKIETILKCISSQYSSPNTAQSEKIDSYCVVNLKIIQPVIIRSCQSKIFVHFDNLFDTDFESHAGYPDDGFRFICGVIMDF